MYNLTKIKRTLLLLLQSHMYFLPILTACKNKPTYVEFNTTSNKNFLVGGSTAIVLKAHNYIAISADTKLVSLDATMEDAGKINKIKLIKTFAYVNVGLFKDKKGILDVDQIVADAARESSDLYKIHQIVVDQISKKLPKAFTDIKLSNPNCYNNFILNGHNSISIAFVGIVNEKLEIIASRFYGTDQNCTHNLIDTSAPLGLLLFGAHSEIDRYLDDNPNPLRNGLESGMEFLIGLEAKKQPNYVALPIDLLLLQRTGFSWLRYNK